MLTRFNLSCTYSTTQRINSAHLGLDGHTSTGSASGLSSTRPRSTKLRRRKSTQLSQLARMSLEKLNISGGREINSKKTSGPWPFCYPNTTSSSCTQTTSQLSAASQRRLSTPKTSIKWISSTVSSTSRRDTCSSKETTRNKLGRQARNTLSTVPSITRIAMLGGNFWRRERLKKLLTAAQRSKGLM